MASGEPYARLFRKAGVFVGKGDRAAALQVLEEGLELAQRNGDAAMTEVFREQIAAERAVHTPQAGPASNQQDE